MANFIDTIKAILTRLIFAAHGLVAIYKAYSLKDDPWYWYLAITILLLCFEGVFTLTIKETQEWKWFCPSVFLYLASVCPSIWLIELDKLDTRLAKKNAAALGLSDLIDTTTALQEIPIDLENIPIQVDNDTLVVIIEQFLMLILIIGRWMLPKGDLTRDQLSQLLLVYIGTAADIIEFFDSFKDEKVNTNKVLCIMVLSIWSWSLLQFTFVLTATKGRKTRITQEEKPKRLERAKEICCSIDVWGILINIILQDAPFFVFRVMLIAYYRLISYMNIFFTCKNTLVITLQFYRLFVVQLEKKEALKKEAEAAKKKLMKKRVLKQDLLGGNPNKSRRGGGSSSSSKNPDRRTRSPKEPKSSSKERRSKLKESGSSGANLVGGGNSSSKLSSADSSRQSRLVSSGRNKTFSTEDGASLGSHSPSSNRVKPNDRRRKAGMLAQKSLSKQDVSSSGGKPGKVPSAQSIANKTPAQAKTRKTTKNVTDDDDDAGVMNEMEGEFDGSDSPLAEDMAEEVDIIEIHAPGELLDEDGQDFDIEGCRYVEDIPEDQEEGEENEDDGREDMALIEVEEFESEPEEDSESGILMMELSPSRRVHLEFQPQMLDQSRFQWNHLRKLQGNQHQSRLLLDQYQSRHQKQLLNQRIEVNKHRHFQDWNLLKLQRRNQLVPKFCDHVPDWLQRKARKIRASTRWRIFFHEIFFA
eukprot:maker-scaffold18_size714446-snap-gene-5.17 protein:Tk08487 transcript:maker-scaffold18_size714446-snap-gene-5.17-mRNA-1 annotation:"hypothetical protein DAPPUDRAFT_55716"